MEDTKFVENHDILLTEKMKSTNSHDEIMESGFSESPDSKDSPILSNAKQELKSKEPLKKSVNKSQEKMNSLRKNLISEAIPSVSFSAKDSRKLDKGGTTRIVSEAKKAPPVLGKEISLEVVPRENQQEQEVKKANSVNTLKKKAKHTATQIEEPNPQENPTEKSLKSQTEGPSKANVSVAAKKKTINSEQDHQMTGEMSKAAAKDQMKQPKDSHLNTAKEQTIKPEEKYKDMPEEKNKDMPEFVQMMEVKKRLSDEIDSGVTEANLIEEERRKSWKSLITEISEATFFQTSNSSFESSTYRSLVMAILQRSAKLRYKRQMALLKENYTFRLRLLKQLKHDIKHNYQSEAQQLYLHYSSIEQKTQNTLNTRPLDTARGSKR